MKKSLNTLLLSTFLILTSCAHHRHDCKSCDKSQCKMHKDGKTEQCPMNSDQKESAETDTVESATKK